MEIKIPLEPAHFYHIYNHANGFDNFFKERYDYQNFLNGYIKYIVPICNTFAYCFMPNHFHFFVQIKSEPELVKTLRTNEGTAQVGCETIRYRFSHYFNSYAQHYNKKYKRDGSLFRSGFKRKAVDTNEYFLHLVHYIHSNPVKDRFVNKIEQWEFSSYNPLLYSNDTFLNKGTVFEYFGDIDKFMSVHQNVFDTASNGPWPLKGS